MSVLLALQGGAPTPVTTRRTLAAAGTGVGTRHPQQGNN
jgi:hypothetical protein